MAARRSTPPGARRRPPRSCSARPAGRRRRTGHDCRMKSAGPARVAAARAADGPRCTPLRTAAVFLVMMVAPRRGHLHAARGRDRRPVIGARKGFAGDNGPAIDAWLDTPGGIVVAASGDIYLADSNNHVVRRIDRAQQHQHHRRQLAAGAGFSRRLRPGHRGAARHARRRRHRAGRRSRSWPIRITIACAASTGRRRSIMTIAGSGESGYDGDDKPATEAVAEQPERCRRGAQRRHLHCRHAELPRPDDRPRDRA